VRRALVVALLLALPALAQPLPPQTVTRAGTAAPNAVTVQGSAGGVAIPVTGTVTTGGLTDAQLRATPVPVSGTVAVTSATLATEATLSTLNGKVPSNLTVTSTRLLVDPSGVTSPVSAASLPLPSGAATEATQARTATGSTPNCSSLSGAASDVLASDSTRKRFDCVAKSANTDTVFLALGTPATTSKFPLEPGQSYGTREYTGAVSVIVNSGTQSVCCIEVK